MGRSASIRLTKRVTAVSITILLVLVLLLSIPMLRVFAASYTKYFSRYASSYTGTISMPTSSFSITEGVSWLSVSRSSYSTFMISATENTGDQRQATVTVRNGSMVDYYTIVQSAGRFLVTFNANGGSGGPGSQYKLYSSSITISTAQPTRTGYTFLGWSDSSTASSPTYYPGGTYSSLSSSTLYAVWKVNTYTVSYDANGGTGGPAPVSVAYGSYCGIAAGTPTRTGYNFLGWATSSTATTAMASSSVFQVTSNMTLYAVWQIKTYTVNFNGNGGTLTAYGTTTKAVSVTHGQALTLSTASRTGYTFQGWSTSSTATTASYGSGQLSITSNMTLYAVWKVNTYTVSYNANGGTGGPAPVSVAYGSYCGIAAGTPTRTDYTFKGWATTSTATTAMASSSTFQVTSDITLYAVWQRIVRVLTLDANGGTLTDYNTTTHKLDIYQNVATPLTATAFRTGFRFLGWSTDPDATSPMWDPYLQYTKISISENTTIYAVWEQILCTITYNASGGTGGPEGATVGSGTWYVIPTEKPILSDYTFLGWADTEAEADSGIVEYIVTGSPMTITSDLNLFAVWERTALTLTYDANGGTLKHYDTDESYNTNTYTQTVYSNEKFDVLVTAEKQDYYFKGWATKENPTEVIFMPEKYYETGRYRQMSIIENTSLVAVWEQIHCTITYKANGGTGGPTGATVASGTWYVIPAEEPTFSDKKFVGWATTEEKADRGIVEYIVTGSPMTITSDLNLFAVWDVYIITYSFYTYENNYGVWGYGDFGKVEEIFHTDTIAQITDEQPPERNGYTFLGWTTKRDFTLSKERPVAESYVEYTAGQTIEAPISLSLYGVWYLNTNGWDDGAYLADFFYGPTVDSIKQVNQAVIEDLDYPYRQVITQAIRDFREMDGSNAMLLIQTKAAGGHISYYSDRKYIYINTSAAGLYHELGHLIDLSTGEAIGLNYDFIEKKVKDVIADNANIVLNQIIGEKASSLGTTVDVYVSQYLNNDKVKPVENVIGCFLTKNTDIEKDDKLNYYNNMSELEQELFDRTQKMVHSLIKGHSQYIYSIVTNGALGSTSNYQGETDEERFLWEESEKDQACGELCADVIRSLLSGEEDSTLDILFPGVKEFITDQMEAAQNT